MADEETGPAGTPRWVKVLGIAVVALVILVATALLSDRGRHGPGRHAPSSTQTPAGDAGGHRPPGGAHTQPSR